MFNNKPLPDISVRAQSLRELIVDLYHAEVDLKHVKAKYPYDDMGDHSTMYEYEETKCRELANQLEYLIFGEPQEEKPLVTPQAVFEMMTDLASIGNEYVQGVQVFRDPVQCKRFLDKHHNTIRNSFTLTVVDKVAE